MNIPSTVRLIDVGPRDGLQNEKQPVPAAIKIELVHRLQAAGLKEIEVTSYVSPKWVPQMADNHEVMAGITRHAGVRYSVLTPNLKGFEAALADRPDEIVVFGAASEAFSQKNINCSIAESIERFAPVVAAAQAAGIAVRGAMSCTVGCPVRRRDRARTRGVPGGAHERHRRAARGRGRHHRRGHAAQGAGGHRSDAPAFRTSTTSAAISTTPTARLLSNTLAALELGVWNFQSSVAGLGGCPYAKGATGNVATEDVVYLLHGMGIETGIDLDQLVDAGQFISEYLKRPSGSRVARALLAKRAS